MIVRMQDGFHAGCGVNINERPAEHRRPLARISLGKRDIALIDAGTALLLKAPHNPVVVVVDHQLQPLAWQRSIRPQTEREHAHPWVSRGLPAVTHINLLPNSGAISRREQGDAACAAPRPRLGGYARGRVSRGPT